MARLVARLSKYADSGLALILAIGVGILALADIASTNDVNGAILLTLGLVATSSLRNRAREEAMDTQVHDVLQTTAAILTRMPARTDELESTRRALTESSSPSLISPCRAPSPIATSPEIISKALQAPRPGRREGDH